MVHTCIPSTRETNKEALLLFSAGYRRRLVSKAKEQGREGAQAGEHLPYKYGDPRTHAKIPDSVILGNVCQMSQ